MALYRVAIHMEGVRGRHPSVKDNLDIDSARTLAAMCSDENPRTTFAVLRMTDEFGRYSYEEHYGFHQRMGRLFRRGGSPNDPLGRMTWREETGGNLYDAIYRKDER